jgi:sugar/nucleoside kinase (ribokinase family)
MSSERLPQRAAAVLASRGQNLASQHVTIGLDGFVDEIVAVVDKRESPEKFTRLPTLSAFAQRVARAAGRSSNAELVVTRVKLGGNGPIMANALAAFGAPVTYIGNLGYPHVHPAFEEFATRATVFSVAEPGHTDALEFDDGKLMLGKVTPLNDITWENLVGRVGRDRLFESFSRARLIGLQNWTMIPHMSDIWRHVLDEICPKLPTTNVAAGRRAFFFDLADPERRDPRDIQRAVELIGKFQDYFDTHLGLNEKESFEIGHVLGYDGHAHGEEAVNAVARFIQHAIRISAVVVHPRAYAVAASAAGAVHVHGPFTPKPLISTGAGDHFNAGFCLGKLIGADNEIALQLGVGTSGFYVRTGHSPSVNELVEFLRSL